MKKAEITLYSFKELSAEAKEKAINDQADFLLSIGQEIENEDGEMETVYDNEIEDEDVIDSIEANDYLFFADGALAHITNYVGNHKRAGEIDFHFHGETIKL